MKLRSKKGFSLVELIIVIAILGIIAVIAVPNLTNVQKSSQVSADIRTAEQIGKAVRIWLTDADINKANTREGLLTTANSALYSGLTDISSYISTGYTANALTGGKFFVSLVNNKVVVSIDTAAPAKPTNASTVYKLSGNLPAAGVAYIEGVSVLETAAGKANL